MFGKIQGSWGIFEDVVKSELVEINGGHVHSMKVCKVLICDKNFEEFDRLRQEMLREKLDPAVVSDVLEI